MDFTYILRQQPTPPTPTHPNFLHTTHTTLLKHLTKKYSTSQSYFHNNIITQLIHKKPTNPATIQLSDIKYNDPTKQHIQKYYSLVQGYQELPQLFEYYKYYTQQSMCFLNREFQFLAVHHEKKKAALYVQLKKQLNISDSEDGISEVTMAGRIEKEEERGGGVIGNVLSQLEESQQYGKENQEDQSYCFLETVKKFNRYYGGSNKVRPLKNIDSQFKFMVHTLPGNKINGKGYNNNNKHLDILFHGKNNNKKEGSIKNISIANSNNNNHTNNNTHTHSTTTTKNTNNMITNNTNNNNNKCLESTNTSYRHPQQQQQTNNSHINSHTITNNHRNKKVPSHKRFISCQVINYNTINNGSQMLISNNNNNNNIGCNAVNNTKINIKTSQDLKNNISKKSSKNKRRKSADEVNVYKNQQLLTYLNSKVGKNTIIKKNRNIGSNMVITQQSSTSQLTLTDTKQKQLKKTIQFLRTKIREEKQNFSGHKYRQKQQFLKKKKTNKK